MPADPLNNVTESNGSRSLPPALALVELASIVRGVAVLDAMVKRAPVTLHRALHVSPGKYLILIRGGVAEVDEAFQAGLEVAADTLVDRLFLPQAHEALLRSLDEHYAVTEIDSLGLFETYRAAAAIRSLDSALKATEVALVGQHLCTGIGGKGYWIVSGQLADVQEAITVATASVTSDVIVSSEVIARPHNEAIEAYLAPWRR